MATYMFVVCSAERSLFLKFICQLSVVSLQIWLPTSCCQLVMLWVLPVTGSRKSPDSNSSILIHWNCLCATELYCRACSITLFSN